MKRKAGEAAQEQSRPNDNHNHVQKETAKVKEVEKDPQGDEAEKNKGAILEKHKEKKDKKQKTVNDQEASEQALTLVDRLTEAMSDKSISLYDALKILQADPLHADSNTTKGEEGKKDKTVKKGILKSIHLRKTERGIFLV